MPIARQVLKRIEIDQLKGVKDLEIDFQGNQLTAILGPNGTGKSTIIHALACVNNPVAHPYQTSNHKFSEFFTPTTHSIWTGSSFRVIQDYRDGANEYIDHQTHFRKQQSRWAPRYVTRIERYVSYIGIRASVPIIETEPQKSMIQFNSVPLIDAHSTRVRTLAGQVMNRQYTTFASHNVGDRKRYIGVAAGGVHYSSLSMGAGEQRIFHILSEVHKAPNHGLILIDEIDLLMHQEALLRLLDAIRQIAENKHLQVIFTTHSHSILHLSYINFRHLYQTPNKTLCFSQTKPDTLRRLTGENSKPLEVFVEDDLARQLVKKISAENGLAKYVEVTEFGAAINCFTSVGGAILNHLHNLDNMLFVLDGDEYRTNDEKQERIAKVITGDTPAIPSKRALALSKITQFVLPDGQRPERYYHGLICGLADAILNAEQLEIVMAAREIVNPDNGHKFFDDVIERMGYDRSVGLSKLVDLLSLTIGWAALKEKVHFWLAEKAPHVLEEIA